MQLYVCLFSASLVKDGSLSCTYQVQAMATTTSMMNFLLAIRSRRYSVVSLFERLIKKIFRTLAIRNNLITFPCTAKVNVRQLGVRLLVLLVCSVSSMSLAGNCFYRKEFRLDWIGTVFE